MSNPPAEIDGAKVLEWAWSGSKSFGPILDQAGSIYCEIFGLAICRYTGSEQIYRFSCNCNWESEQDSMYSTIQEAKINLPTQYQNSEINWVKNIS